VLRLLENKIMQVIYSFGQKKNPFLLTPNDIISMSGQKNVTKIELENILQNLAMDGYFDIIYSERNGDTVYCITLLTKGKAFSRSKKNFKRNLILRIVLSASLAVMSFLIGLLLKTVF
jgi:hypothetical protein